MIKNKIFKILISAAFLGATAFSSNAMQKHQDLSVQREDNKNSISNKQEEKNIVANFRKVIDYWNLKIDKEKLKDDEYFLEIGQEILVEMDSIRESVLVVTEIAPHRSEKEYQFRNQFVDGCREFNHNFRNLRKKIGIEEGEYDFEVEGGEEEKDGIKLSDIKNLDDIKK